jgi:hypothetical protein
MSSLPPPPPPGSPGASGLPAYNPGLPPPAGQRPGALWAPTGPGLPNPVGGTPEAKLKPSSAGVWIGSILMVLGVVTGIVIAAVSLVQLSDQVDRYPRLELGAEQPLNFSEGGTWVVYREYRAGDSEPDVPRGIEVLVAPASFTGDLVDCDSRCVGVKPYINDFSFSVNGTAGVAVVKMEIPSAGDYRVLVTDSSETYRVFIGRRMLRAIAKVALLSIGVGLAVFGPGLALLITTLVRRKRARRRRGVGPSTWSPGAPPMPFGTPAPPGA